MSTHRLTERAAVDLHDIKSYYQPRSRPFTRRLLSELRERFRQLARFPLIGRTREDFGPGLRSVAVDDYVIFYRPGDPNGVEVVRILRGSRQITPELFEP